MRTLVLGAAVSGLAAARNLVEDGVEVAVYDLRPEKAESISAVGAESMLGEWDPSFLKGVDLVVTSPGIPETSQPIADTIRAGIRLIGELELAASKIKAPLIAVTGTNGKTTVTSLISAMLERSGKIAPAVGNIGVPLVELVGREIDVAVVEASSFQLRFVEGFHPRVAVITNFAPDHLDWHPNLDSYFAAKARIVENQDASDLVVFDASDVGASKLASLSSARKAGVSGTSRLDSGGVEDESVWIGDAAIPRRDLRVGGAAFLLDIVAAGVAAREMGASSEGVSDVARGFVPGSHRLTTVGVWDGIRFVDDSKATNPHAALAAIRSFPSVILIAGGLSKGLDLSPLGREPNIKAVIGIGESGHTVVEAARVYSESAGDMESAVRQGIELAEPGDTILLAPGGASFDMYGSYSERGDAFSTVVRGIMGER